MVSEVQEPTWTMVSLSLHPPVPFNYRIVEKTEKPFQSVLSRFRTFKRIGRMTSEQLTLLHGRRFRGCVSYYANYWWRQSRLQQSAREVWWLFQIRKNLVFERSAFNQARQLSEESAEQFITRLHLLADNSEFGNLREEMIRDHLIIGIHDKLISEWFQLESGLNLQQWSDKGQQCKRNSMLWNTQ